jgi:nucleotide-binding universal stress UspA family protein
MYEKILIPLDGSELAECVLPHVEALVTGCKIPNVVFARVIEPFRQTGGDSSVLTAEERHRIESLDKANAEKYLDNLVNRLNYDKALIRKEIIFGKPGDCLADYATNNGVDLIMIATHGRSGVSRWVWGSVADRILRSACVPVLMVRAPGCIPGI